MKKILLLLVVIPAAACASAQAKQPLDRPALEVPPVPERVIEPLPVPEKAEKPPTPEPIATEPAPTPPPPRKPPPKAETSKPEPPKPEPAVPEPPPPAPPPSVPPLRTANTASDGAEASRQVRDILDRAKKSLDFVDYRLLSAEQRELYNQAKLLLQQSEDKHKSNDFELAKNYAERAEQIAKQLQKR